MDTYFSLVPDDVWYYLLMQESVEGLVEIRRRCPYLKECSSREIFHRDYLAQAGPTAGCVVWILCRAEEPLEKMILEHHPAGNLLLEAYTMEDYPSVDWLIDVLRLMLPYRLVTFLFTTFPTVPFPQSLNADLLARIIQRTKLTPAQLCLDETEETVDRIYETYPTADYTEYLSSLLCNYYAPMLDPMIRKMKNYDPQKLLARCFDLATTSSIGSNVDRRFTAGCYLLTQHEYSVDFLYLILNHTNNYMVLKKLWSAQMAQLAIQRRNSRLIYWALDQELPYLKDLPTELQTEITTWHQYIN